MGWAGPHGRPGGGCCGWLAERPPGCATGGEAPERPSDPAREPTAERLRERVGERAGGRPSDQSASGRVFRDFDPRRPRTRNEIFYAF